MSTVFIPSFAVLGFVNEGKTSVVATLSESPKAKPNPRAGATVHCQAFPVIVNGTEVLRFYDTPGFQNSKRALAWFCEQEKCQPPGTDLLTLFRETHAGDPNFSSECELFWPVAEKDAGILYVIDGSARITENYLAEMEMLRMTGRPRMVLINHKDQRKNHTVAWEMELGKFFNQTRRFNAHHATHHDRIALLRALQHMDGRKGWHDGFEEAIDAFERRWDKRRVEAVTTIVRMTGDCLGHVEKANYRHDAELPALKGRLDRKYRRNVSSIEHRDHERLLEIYAHSVKLEELPVLRVPLFHECIWQTLGLPLRELFWAATVSGAMTGLGIDLLLGGHSLGACAVIGGAMGGGGALLAGKQIGRVTFDIPWASRLPTWARPHGRLGGQQVQASCTNVDFIFVLLDRALLLYAALVNRAHAQQSNIQLNPAGTDMGGYTHAWTKNAKEVCLRFAASQLGGRRKVRLKQGKADIERDFFDQVDSALQKMASSSTP